MYTNIYIYIQQFKRQKSKSFLRCLNLSGVKRIWIWRFSIILTMEKRVISLFSSFRTEASLYFNAFHTAWKVSAFGVFLVHIFSHSDWISTVKVGWHSGKFGGHSHSGSGIRINSVCRVILQDHVIRKSCDIIGGNPS